MISLLKEFFNLDEEHAESTLDPITAAQALLFEVIWADHDIDPAEIETMQTLLCQVFEVSREAVVVLTEKAFALHKNAVGLHEFTSALNQQMSQDEKYQVVLAMWRVAYADTRIDALEEHIIRRAADLLYLSHSRFIEAKLAAKESG